MAVVISCDHVFDVLTQGPFPTGGIDDDNVSLHLRACHSCRELAEALRPATELFHESMSEHEVRDGSDPLPAFYGFSSEVGEGAEGSPALMPVTLSRWGASRDTHCRCWGASAVAAIALAVVVGVAWLEWTSLSQSQPAEIAKQSAPRARQAASAPLEARVDKMARGSVQLASPALPQSCFSTIQLARSTLDMTPSAEAVLADCCTRCHHAGATIRVSRGGMRAIASACSSCHRPTAEMG